MSFNNYADVQAALDAEYLLWASGGNPAGRTQQGQEARDWWASQQSSGGGGGGQPAPPTPTPITWMTTPTYTEPGVKQADPDIILDPKTDTSADYIVERFFEELSGTELISISRHDLIDGINVTYNPIVNLSRLRQRFNPSNIIALDSLSQNSFSFFPIDLLSRGINEPYFDDAGNLIVEIDIIRSEENIDVQISESGTVTRVEL